MKKYSALLLEQQKYSLYEQVVAVIQILQQKTDQSDISSVHESNT
jgi:hypothetical protein